MGRLIWRRRRQKGNQGRWQGRKDSNLRPSVLETDALTKLSYAPIGLKRAVRAAGRIEFYPTPNASPPAPN